MKSDFVYTSAPAASADDYVFIKDLIARAHVSGELWALSWTAAAVESELKEAEVWIATDNFSRKLGFAFVRPPGHSWEITLVAVKSELRGSDVFETLLGSIKQRADEGITAGGGAASSAEIDLEVRADNRSAIRAYEKNGFVKIGNRERYYPDGVDAILYRLKSK